MCYGVHVLYNQGNNVDEIYSPAIENSCRVIFHTASNWDFNPSCTGDVLTLLLKSEYKSLSKRLERKPTFNSTGNGMYQSQF